jgi:hypothetical protein
MKVIRPVAVSADAPLAITENSAEINAKRSAFMTFSLIHTLKCGFLTLSKSAGRYLSSILVFGQLRGLGIEAAGANPPEAVRRNTRSLATLAVSSPNPEGLSLSCADHQHHPDGSWSPTRQVTAQYPGKTERVRPNVVFPTKNSETGMPFVLLLDQHYV